MFKRDARNQNRGIIKERDPFDKLFDSFFNDFDEDFFAPLGNLNARLNCFQVDVQDYDNYYIIEADLPGMKKEDVQVEYDKNYLTILACRKDQNEQKKEKYIRRERRIGKFKRSFYIENIDIDKVQAQFEEGVLKIKLEKIEPSGNKKVIDIK